MGGCRTVQNIRHAIRGRPSFYPSDTIREFVVSEALVRKLGLKSPQDIIGKKIDLWGGQHVANVCGVIKDFHTLSLRQPIDPIIMAPGVTITKCSALK